VTSITTVHHSLRNVDSSSSNIGSVVHILDLVDRAAVNAHPHSNMRLISQLLTDFQGALRWFLQTPEKQECHPISRWQSQKLSGCFRVPKTGRIADDSI
jgi:hypothetical protein